MLGRTLSGKLGLKEHGQSRNAPVQVAHGKEVGNEGPVRKKWPVSIGTVEKAGPCREIPG